MRIFGNKVAAYLRLSRDDGDKQESDSIRNQRELIKEYLSKHKDLQYVDEYIDDGYSGTSFERPSFQRLMEDVKERKVNCIIVKDLSRLGRNYIETGRYIEQIFPLLGVRFISILDHYDSAEKDSASDWLVVPFKNLINDAYARDISIKIRSQLDVKRKNGKFIGSFATYGYDKDPNDNNHLIIDPYAADIVRLIFRMKLSGCSQAGISDRLNGMGILPPAAYKRNNGMRFRGGFHWSADPKWEASSVRSILCNEIYTGTMVQGNSIVMPVKNMVNAMYAKDFSRKDAAYYAHCRETGKVMKKDMPYGYRFSEETSNFEIDPETEPYVRMVFAWTLAGVPRSEIANRMNLLNVLTPGKLRYDKKSIWRSETVRYIQINPAYAGIHVMGKTEKRKCDGIDSHKVRREDWVRYEDSHEAYITKEDQKTLEERLIRNQKRRVEHLALRQDIRDRMPDLFSGKVFCADCGRRMRFMRVGHDRKRVDLSFCVYYCDYRHKTTECSNGGVQMNYLRMVVLDQIRALYKTACDTDEVIRLMQQQAETENGSGFEKKIRRLQIQYQETEKQLIKTYTEYTEKSIDSETYRTTVSGILAEKEQIEKQLKQQRVQQEKTERFISEIRAFKKSIGDRIRSGEMDEPLIRELVKKVTVRNNEEVTIEFTCADLFQNSIMDEWMKTDKEAAQA